MSRLKKIIDFVFFKTKFRKSFNENERTFLLKKNIKISFIFQAINMIYQFSLVPIILNYLKVDLFGVWITLSSFFLWFTFFDFGLGNSLKNKLGECILRKDYNLAKVYVSTSYAILVFISIILACIFVPLYFHVDWNKVFNSSIGLTKELTSLVLCAFVFLSLKFIFDLINVIFSANQESSYINYFSFLSNTISFFSVLLITKVSSKSLLLLGLCVIIPTVIVPLIGGFYYFKKRYTEIKPSLKFIDFSKARPLFGLSLYFFISQVMTFVIYSTDSMVILQLFGPSEVTSYNIAFKYFSIISILFGIISVPLWSSFTHAYSNREFDWISNTIKKFVKIWLILILVVLLMIFLSNDVYSFWLGVNVVIPKSLTVLMGIFVIENSWIIIYTYFIGGIAKMKLITIIHVLAGLINIPLSIYLAKCFDLGVNGVILSTIICLLPQSIIIPIQYKKIINNRAKGIWSQ